MDGESMGGEDEAEVFLSLEDDEPVAAPEPPQENEVLTTEVEPEPAEVLDPEIVDSTFVEDASGSFAVSWPLLGMDCPDCASKAMGALGHMKQVTKSNVSATSGEVKLNINLEEGTLSEVSAVLRSLGHAPDIDHHEIVGVRAKAVAQRNDVPVQKLERVIRRQPGI